MTERNHVTLDGSSFGPGLTVFTGPNGSGKSRAARALCAEFPSARLLSAESQQAFYEAELAADESNFRQGVDTSRTPSELLGEAGRCHPLFERFRLEPLWNRGYRLLSTGEARKVLLLEAVLAKPSLLVLDEPFDGLDRAACADFAEAIIDVAKSVPVVVVGAFGPRLPFFAEAVREVVWFERGQPVFRGPLREYAARWASRSAARRSPPVHLGSTVDPLPPNVPLVDLVKGHIRYGDQVVFEGLDFRVSPGQHTLIEGPNGSGKTSLLEMLTGDHPQAYANELYLFGRRRGSGESVWDIKKKVGLVSSRLHRDYRVGGSIEQVVISGLFDSIGVYQRVEPSHRARARAWLDWLELGVSPNTAFYDLSFGQQRLVLIARACVKLPPLLVLDEPTTGLDAENRALVLELVESLCTQKKCTVLMVTHRADERDFWRERINGAVLSLPLRP